jgi:hypothetical protein
LAAIATPGAGNWKDEWAPRFTRPGVTVVVCFDCDRPGRANAAHTAAALAAEGINVRLVDLASGRDDGYDLSDLHVNGDTSPEVREIVRDHLLTLAAEAAAFVPSKGAPDPAVTFTEFVARRDESAVAALVTSEQGTLLPAGGLAMITAKTHDGKTTLMVGFLLHASTGRDYLGLSFPRPLNVLLIENEGPREAFREKIAAHLGNWPHGGEPRIWDVPADWGQVRISTADTRAQLRAVVEAHHIDLIVSDSLTRFGVRCNGTPEETREFVELLSELGLGRDVAFFFLHHPRTRPEQGEGELERLAGAWQPHCDLILLLQKLDGGRSRLSFPKTRWAQGDPSPAILAFDVETETFSYVGVDEAERRDLRAELIEHMADGGWWTKTKLRDSKQRGGVGGRPEGIEAELADEETFEHSEGDAIGKQRGAVYYRLRQTQSADRNEGPVTPVTSQRSRPETAGPSPSPPRENGGGGDGPAGRNASGYDAAPSEEGSR